MGGIKITNAHNYLQANISLNSTVRKYILNANFLSW